MEKIVDILILGIVQGLTEFLPVSSSGHLVIMGHYLQFKEPGLLLGVMLHLGTLGAVLFILLGTIKEILISLVGKDSCSELKERGICNWFSHPQRRLALFVLLGTIPTGIMGIIFKSWIESLFTMVKPVAGMLLVTGVILWIGSLRAKKPGKEGMNWQDAILIGIAQGIAIIPGISRSGATISAGLMMGMTPQLAAKYSFLLSIPAILGASIVELKDYIHVSSIPWFTYIIGIITAFIVGVMSLKFLLWILTKGQLLLFAIYCWVVGLIVLIIS